MSANKLYSEIFEDFASAPTREAKVAVLRKHGDWNFKEFLNLAFNPDIKFEIASPDYRPSVEPAGLNYQYLDAIMKKMYIYVVGHQRKPTGFSPRKQTSMLTVQLESLHKDEARLLAGVFKKDLGVAFLTPNMVKEAFPDLPFTAE